VSGSRTPNDNRRFGNGTEGPSQCASTAGNVSVLCSQCSGSWWVGFPSAIAQELPSQAPQGTEFWPPLFGYRLKVTDTLLVTVTFLLFAATFALWWSTRRLVKSGENTAKRQLRAYIVATIKGCDVPETNDGIFTFHLAIKNTGLHPVWVTPA
jgi:hypothetical protein